MKTAKPFLSENAEAFQVCIFISQSAYFHNQPISNFNSSVSMTSPNDDQARTTLGKDSDVIRINALAA
jgi:hypothetical protein